MTLWKMYFQQEEVGIEDYSNILKLIKLYFIFAVEFAKSDQGFSFMRRIYMNYRSRLCEIRLPAIIQIAING